MDPDSRRLLLAKQLLTETMLPITEVGFASGFSSLRRFNDAFNRRYGMPPTRLRKKATEDAAAITLGQTSTLRLSYRPPYDWKGILAFLSARALKGIVRGHARLGHGKAAPMNGAWTRSSETHQGFLMFARHPPNRLQSAPSFVGQVESIRELLDHALDAELPLARSTSRRQHD
jgi:helix-turn-helix protein/AlkA-like protein